MFDFASLPAAFRAWRIRRSAAVQPPTTERGSVVSIREDYELRYWSKRLNTTPEKLRRAVGEVGHRAQDLRLYLATDQT